VDKRQSEEMKSKCCEEAEQQGIRPTKIRANPDYHTGREGQSDKNLKAVTGPSVSAAGFHPPQHSI